MATPSRFPPDPRRRVLLVDDDSEMRDAIARQIQGLGYVADAAADGDKALLMAAAYDYDVVVTDLLMPHLNGMQLMSLLAERSAFTCFILMTGTRSSGSHASQDIDGRLTTVLAKPLDERELGSALNHAFEVTAKRRTLFERPEASGRVLLVEDSKPDALQTQRVLSELGFQTTHAASIAEAVRLLHDGAFNTVITELNLRDARGLGAVLRIRECAPEATLIVCSSVSDESLALRAIELGAQDFVQKSCLSPEVLGRAIRFANMRRQGERRIAHTDPLTGLSNHAAFAERLDHAVAQSKRHGTPIGVLFIDLDGFKEINQIYGDDFGDALLKKAATRIARCTREYDVVARSGGNQFEVLASQLADGGELVLAERIRRALAVPFQIDTLDLTISASIGIALYPEHAEEAVLLVRLANEAMCAAKRAGKGRVFRARPARSGGEVQEQRLP
jgi:diguanylate cyclase (GGDEF)-like protein